MDRTIDRSYAVALAALMLLFLTVTPVTGCRRDSQDVRNEQGRQESRSDTDSAAPETFYGKTVHSSKELANTIEERHAAERDQVDEMFGE